MHNRDLRAELIELKLNEHLKAVFFEEKSILLRQGALPALN